MQLELLIQVVHFIIAVIGFGLLVITAILLLEIVVGATRKPPIAREHHETTCSYVVVIPAHNEVGTIEATLQSTLEQISPSGRVLVVADNCTDQTESISHAAGARVIVRTEPDRRGKGYALEFAAHHLAADPPQVVVVLDADCIAEPGTTNSLVATCDRIGRPVQARYTLDAPHGKASLLSRVSRFAWHVKNMIRPTGTGRLGFPCLL